MDTCSSCIWFKAIKPRPGDLRKETGIGDCHFHAPRPHGGNVKWTSVLVDDFCGQYDDGRKRERQKARLDYQEAYEGSFP